MNLFSLKISLFLLTFTLISFPAEAGSFMARVVEIRDARTIVVQRGPRSEDISLAGVEPSDRIRGHQFLRWTLDRAWVMVEDAHDQPGRYNVYRSPDGLFVNREYVLRGFANPTSFDTADSPQVPMTYLGEVNPGTRTEEGRSGRKKTTGKPPKKAPSDPLAPTAPKPSRSRRARR